MEKSIDLCVIVPAFNEEAALAVTLNALKAALPLARIIVVDNASTDRTAQVARELGFDVLSEPRSGKGHAVTRGVRWALDSGAQWVALHDADNEYCAIDLALLVAESQLYDSQHLVMGVGLRQVTLARVHWRSLLANWLARSILRLTSGPGGPQDVLTGTRVFNAACAKALIVEAKDSRELKGFELETVLTRRAMRANVYFAYASVRYTPRSLGEKKISAWDIFPILAAACRN